MFSVERRVGNISANNGGTYIYMFFEIQICTARTVYVVTNKMVCMTSSSENIAVTNRIATISE